MSTRKARNPLRFQQILASAAVVSGIATQGSAHPARNGDDPRIRVALTGFVPEYDVRAADGTLPIRRSKSAFPWIADTSKLRDYWNMRSICSADDGPGLTLHSDADPDHPLLVRTCAEWTAARDAGRYAMSTLEMSREIEFIHASSMLTALANARPAARSSFLDLDLLAATKRLLPPGEGIAAEDAKADGGHGAARDPNEWRIEGNQVWWNDDMTFGLFEPVLFGDLDGDGWEDMLLLTAGGATQGSMRSGSVRAIACIDNGPLVDITCRLPDRLPNWSERERQAPCWNGGHRIAPNHGFTLEEVSPRTDTRQPLRMQLEITDGLLQGTVECEGLPGSTRLVGALGSETGALQALGDSGLPVLDFTFEWSVADGTLTLRGSRSCPNCAESSDFEVRGPVMTHDERMRAEGWTSEIRFSVAGANLLLRRGCGSRVNGRPSDAICVDAGGVITEIARLDRIEWAQSDRPPEAEPPSNEELQRKLPSCVFRVTDGAQMLLLDGWTYGASSNNPWVIAIPIRNGRLLTESPQMFPLAEIELKEGVARVVSRDLRGRGDRIQGIPQASPVEWEWLGKAWASE